MKQRYILGLILTLVFMLVLSSVVQAQEGGFKERFDDPSLPDWDHSPDVKVVDGVLRIQPGHFAGRPGAWGGDMSLKLFIRRISTGEFVVSYRASETGAYHLVLGGPSTALQRENQNGLEELASSDALPIPEGEWFEIDIIVSDDTHTILVNGDIGVLTVSDPSPLPPGGISFESLGEAAIEVDEIELDAHSPAEEAGEPAQPVERGAGRCLEDRHVGPQGPRHGRVLVAKRADFLGDSEVEDLGALAAAFG